MSFQTPSIRKMITEGHLDIKKMPEDLEKFKISFVYKRKPITSKGTYVKIYLNNKETKESIEIKGIFIQDFNITYGPSPPEDLKSSGYAPTITIKYDSNNNDIKKLFKLLKKIDDAFKNEEGELKAITGRYSPSFNSSIKEENASGEKLDNPLVVLKLKPTYIRGKKIEPAVCIILDNDEKNNEFVPLTNDNASELIQSGYRISCIVRLDGYLSKKAELYPRRIVTKAYIKPIEENDGTLSDDILNRIRGCDDYVLTDDNIEQIKIKLGESGITYNNIMSFIKSLKSDVYLQSDEDDEEYDDNV